MNLAGTLIRSCSLALGAALALGLPAVAHATTDMEWIVPDRAQDILDGLRDRQTRQLSPLEIHRRTELVLAHFGVVAEPEQQPELNAIHRFQTLKGAQALLPYIDFEAQFARFMKFGKDSLTAFRERDALLTPDFQVELAQEQSRTEGDRQEFIEHLKRAAAENSPALPLAGLRIALDPGHMGDKAWDDRTGKWVHSKDGRVLSEGVLTLQTAILLERELKKLGAEVLLTRHRLDAVEPTPYEKLDLASYGRAELRYSSLLNWFQNLIAGQAAGQSGDAAVLKAFEKSDAVGALFSEKSRSSYFILRADLDARIRVINEFKPDLTLVIHYDVSPPKDDPHGLSTSGVTRTKAYVSGAVTAAELSTRDSRKTFAQHLLNPQTWDTSVRLSRAMLRSLSSGLGIGLDSTGGSETVRQVEPGLFSRNLAVSRKLVDHAVSYLEILYYNAPVEFEALSKAQYPLMIDGKNVPYSARLAQVVAALRQGTLNFVASFHK